MTSACGSKRRNVDSWRKKTPDEGRALLVSPVTVPYRLLARRRGARTPDPGSRRLRTTVRIIVINLDQDTGRRARVESRLAELGLSWERLSAVDGRRLEPHHERLIDRAAHVARGLEFSPGAIGCWLSHRQAQRMVAEGTEAMALILEDDIAIADELPEVLERIERGDAGPVRRDPPASLQDAPEVRPGAPDRRRLARIRAAGRLRDAGLCHHP